MRETAGVPVPATAPATPPDTLDVVEVLTRAGATRARAAALLGEQLDEVDGQLVADVLRAHGRVGDTLALRGALVEACALLRALDAFERQLVTLDELGSGVALQSARTGRFAGFGEARVVLRTVGELLDRAGSMPERALRAQVELLHRDVRTWLEAQLLGDGAATAGPASGVAGDVREPHRIAEPSAARTAHELVDELREGAAGHPVTGILGAAWIRGWSAVPVAGDHVGEEPEELDRLAAALDVLDPRPRELLQIDLRRQPRWRVTGRELRIGDGLRRSWSLPADRAGLQLAAAERLGWCVLATTDLAFAIVEGAGHHALLGPTEFVTAACDASPLEAVARFREHVESLAEPGEDPPEDLLLVAERFGRLRRRSR